MVAVTGASGFIGASVIDRLRADGIPVRATVRRVGSLSTDGTTSWSGAVLEGDFDWRPVLDGCDAVIHTAARVHVMRDQSRDPIDDYRRVNVQGSARLARQAAEAGVRRFIFLSSVKVNGETTSPGSPFTADTPPAPSDPYGLSKREAEVALFAVGAATKMEIVIIRPVLVYGSGVKGNFLTLMRVLARGLPLPLGSVDNRRSLIGVRNLADLIVSCLRHPRAVNQVFLASDGDDLSTTDLLRRTAAALGRRPLLIPVPVPLMRLAAAVLGKGAAVGRLLDSLQVDISKTRALLDWSPPKTVDEELRATAQWFLHAEGLRP